VPGRFFHPRAGQDVAQSVIAFVAGVFVDAVLRQLQQQPRRPGAVQVVGSAAVNSYCRVSGAIRVNRSIRCNPLDDPRRLLSVEKFES